MNREEWRQSPSYTPSHEIVYAKDDPQRARKARLAAAQWLGFSNYRLLSHLLRCVELTPAVRIQIALFANFEGYPVTAMANYWKGNQ